MQGNCKEKYTIAYINFSPPVLLGGFNTVRFLGTQWWVTKFYLPKLAEIRWDEVSAQHNPI